MARGVLAERLRRDRCYQLGVIPVATVLAAAALAPWLAPHDRVGGDLRKASFLEPDGRSLVGTDTQGHDALSRVLYGARLSLLVGWAGMAREFVLAAEALGALDCQGLLRHLRAIGVAVLGFNLAGDALREAYGPKLRSGW